jgi:hypothetical protein
MPVKEQANASAVLEMHLLQKTLQDLSTFGERRFCPFFLGFTGLCNNAIDSISRNGVDKSQ